MLRFAALVTLACFSADAQTLFSLASEAAFDAGAGPYGAVAADFDGDGVLDLAYADYGSSSVLVLLGKGKGGFAPGRLFRAGLQTLAVVAGDFNGDGHIDLAALNGLSGPQTLGQGDITILLGDGKGNFTAAQGARQLTNGFPRQLTAGDFNRDGYFDLAVANQNGVTVFLGDGKGGFRIAGNPYGTDATAVAAVDVNRDGKLDFCLASYGRYSVAVFLGDGTGGFTALPETLLPDGAFPSSLLSGDWNSDGLVDLAVATADNTVRVMLGDGRGGFQLRSTLLYGTHFGSQLLTTADFDGDGHADLVMSGGEAPAVWLGDGSGLFRVSGTILSARLSAGFGVAADWNGDGKPDLVFSSGTVWLNALETQKVNPLSVTLHATQGQGPLPPIPIALGSGASAMSDQPWAQITGAGSQLSVDPSGLGPGFHRAVIHVNAPGFFGALITVSLEVAVPSGTLEPLGPAVPAVLSQVALADFNGDGKPDLLSRSGSTLQIRLNAGNGQFGEARMFPLMSGPMGLDAGAQVVGDFDQDGKLDVVTLTIAGIVLYAGDGAGGLGSARQTSIQSDVRPLTAVLGDFNGDGVPDLAVSASGAIVRIFLGDGNGDFRELPDPLLDPAAESGTISLQSADFNRDGLPDLLYLNALSHRVGILLNDGHGRFHIKQVIDFGGRTIPGPVTIGDWNRDGKLDLAIASDGAVLTPGNVSFVQLISFYAGDGAGVFTKTGETRLTALGLTNADLDGDGTPDLIANTGTATVVLLGDGAGTFKAPITLAATGSALARDLNGDGRTDLLLVGTGAFSVLLGAPAHLTIAVTQNQANPFSFGQTVSLTVVVTAGANTFGTPTGTVTLFDGATIGTQPVTNGMATFTSKYSPGTHLFRAVYNADSRFATASGELTVVETGTPTVLRALDNTQPLRTIVTDENGNPVRGVGVRFVAPLYGPSGLFGNANFAVAITDATGTATAPALIPNKYPGDFAVTATVSGYPGLSVVFALGN